MQSSWEDNRQSNQLPQIILGRRKISPHDREHYAKNFEMTPDREVLNDEIIDDNREKTEKLGHLH